MFLSGSALPGRMSTFAPGDDRVADLQADRLQDVALLAVGVGQQRDARRAVRVVLDRRHLRRNVALVALEVDDAVHPLVAAAAPPRRELAAGCCGRRSSCSGSTSGLCGSVGRDLVEGLDGLEPLTRRRRDCNLRIGHDVTRPPGIRASSAPSRSFTYAFFQSGRWPAKRPCRLILPCAMLVRMLRHLRAEQLLDRRA